MFYNRFKRTLFSLCLSLLLTGVASYAAPLKVVAITEDFASIAKDIGGDHIQVTSLVKGSRNLHDIHPKPSMVMALKHADLIIRLGMSQDSWIDSLIQVARNSALFHGSAGHLDCSIDIQKLEIPHGKIDGSMGDVHQEGNPHYWLSPFNGKIIARQIRDRLSTLDPENAAVYSKNFVSFSNHLDAKIIDWKHKLSAIHDTRIITYHKIWPYFFEAFDLHSLGELEPLPGIPPSTSHLIKLETRLRSSASPTLVLMANYYPKKVGHTFANRVQAHYVQVPVTVGTHGIRTYTELFDHIIEKITL